MTKFKIAIALVAVCTANAFAQDSAPAPEPAQTNRPTMMRISGGVIVGLVEHRTLPEYPGEAITKNIEGDVIFKIVIDETGKIVFSTPVEGDALLVAASADALRDFHYRPYLLNGAPIRIESQVGFHFALRKTKGQVEYMSTIPFRPEFRTGALTDKGVLILSRRQVSEVRPQFPQELAGKTGSVYLSIVIGEDGKVQDVKVIGGDKPFIGPVVAAVKQSVYEPELVDGKPTVATTQASYHFGPRP